MMIGLIILAQNGNLAFDQAGVAPGEIFSIKNLGDHSDFESIPRFFELSVTQICQNLPIFLILIVYLFYNLLCSVYPSSNFRDGFCYQSYVWVLI